MPATFDLSPYDSRPPMGFARAVLALTRRLPANWLGLRLSMPLRRLAIDRLGDRPVDTTLWGTRARLYPRSNSCEKNALFTPQLFELAERTALATAIDRALAAGGTFTFVDLGANVGLYSLFVAGRSRGRARVLAIEPQPGIIERLAFNLRANPELPIEMVPVAVTDHDGVVELAIDPRDSGGTQVVKDTATQGAETVRVRCRPLAAILADAGIAAIDALKIDIEGAEDLALAPFLRDAPDSLLPRLLIIEDRAMDWRTDLFALIAARGYVHSMRVRHNVIFRLI
jgi:FkbM family methyltransferase